MKAEELVSLAACHGVDLVAAAKVSAPPRASDQKILYREYGAFKILMQPPRNRARGTPSMSVERPPWTIAELGQAAAGVPDIAFRAACFAYAGDRGQYWKLHAALYAQTLQIAKERKWPDRVTGLHNLPVLYLQHLAKLVLDHDANQNEFVVCEALYAIYLAVPDRVWKSQIAERFVTLQGVWLDWLGVAMQIMQPRLRNDEI